MKPSTRCFLQSRIKYEGKISWLDCLVVISSFLLVKISFIRMFVHPEDKDQREITSIGRERNIGKMLGMEYKKLEKLQYI